MPKPNSPTAFTDHVSTVSAASTNANNTLWYNALTNYVLYTDVADTITVTHTFNAGANFANGTFDFSGGTVANLTTASPTFTGTVTAAAIAMSGALSGATTGAFSSNVTVGGTLGVTGAVGAGGDITVTRAGQDAKLNLISTGGSGRSYTITSATDGGLYINDNSASQSRWLWSQAGHFLAVTDNAYDIGATGTSRPRDLFVGRNVAIAGTATVGGTLGVTGTTTLAALSATTGSFSSVVGAARGSFAGSSGGTSDILVAGITGVTNGLQVITDASNNIAARFIDKNGVTQWTVGGTGVTLGSTLSVTGNVTFGADIIFAASTNLGSSGARFGSAFGASLNLSGTLTGAAITGTTISASTAFVGGSNAASSGIVRIANNTSITSRNAANSGDVALLSVDASDVIQIAAGGAPTNFTGAVSMGTTLTVTTGTTSVLNVATGTGAAGRIYKTATNGVLVRSTTGSLTDFALLDPAGNAILTVATGSVNVRVEGTITTPSSINGDTLTAVTSATITGVGGSAALTLTNGNLVVSNGAATVSSTVTVSGNASGNLILPHRTAPGTPTDGAIWTTSSGMFVRINGVTKTVTLT